MSSTNPTPCSAPQWGAPHEIRIGELEGATPAVRLRDVRPADRSRLPARNRDVPHLLQSQLLRGSLQKRCPADRTPDKSTMNPSRPEPPDSQHCGRPLS